ncbi:aspartic proteinase 39-like [Euphorbia lathyris]|uniref:aspartic proteinase 39-like n=1 Tax=Euphorbia lathyris TaxID=212925 RepID=UPI003313B1C6
MDLGRLVSILMAVVVFELGFAVLASGNFVFKVQHKFNGRERSLSALRAHDARRHSRILSTVDVDLPLGGNGHPAEAGLYFAKIGLGNPSKDYFVQVDTGSDILWVNCANCDKCPTKSDLGVELTLYDPKKSGTMSRVYCGDDFCAATYNGVLEGCTKDLPCQYNVVYGDGSSTAGFFVKDTVVLAQATGDDKTTPTNGSIVFGCGAKQSGELGTSSEALDGILGFGQANSSMISQLAAEGKVKKMFAHCLDNVKGGGIFAIGNVVSPKVNTTPMVPNQAHYNVVMREIEVDGDVLDLPSDVFDSSDRKGTIIDSGTTLAYLPNSVYEPLMTKILSHQPGLKLHTVEEQFMCFQYSGKVNDGFPDVKFLFEDSLNLNVHPDEYLFRIREEVWCFGWQNSGVQSKDGRDMTLLGDLVLSNKLVVYDLENQAIGWTNHNCSSSIKLKDSTGGVYSVGAHNINSAPRLISGTALLFSLLVFAVFSRVQ